MNPIQTLVFVACYYLVWFSSLIFASVNWPYLALFISGIVSYVQMTFIPNYAQEIKHLWWMVFFTVVGFFIDSVFQTFQIIHFDSNPWWSGLAPPWILALWLNFSVLCLGLGSLLKKMIKWLPLLAFLGFPLTYQAGANWFHVASFHTYPTSQIIMGCVWAAVFPLLIILMPKKNT